MIQRAIRLAGAAVLAATLSVQAQNVAPAGPPAGQGAALLEATYPARLADLIRNAGYEAVLDKTDSGNPVIDSAAEGANFAIYFVECENGADCWAVHFVSAFTLNEPVGLEVLNDWNRDRTIGQASLLEDDAAQIAHYMTLRHGVSEGNFLYMFDQWRIALRDFMVHIGFRR